MKLKIYKETSGCHQPYPTVRVSYVWFDIAAVGNTFEIMKKRETKNKTVVKKNSKGKRSAKNLPEKQNQVEYDSYMTRGLIALDFYPFP